MKNQIIVTVEYLPSSRNVKVDRGPRNVGPSQNGNSDQKYFINPPLKKNIRPTQNKSICVTNSSTSTVYCTEAGPKQHCNRYNTSKMEQKSNLCLPSILLFESNF